MNDDKISFGISKREHQIFLNWKKQFDDSYAGAIGGAYTWEFCPTNIGTTVTVKRYTGEELELRELS
jgi:hypothetical protein